VEVDVAADEEMVDIPLRFTDRIGNNWTFNLKLKTVAGNESDIRNIDMLYSNYPNPFNPVTSIKFSLAEGKQTTLKIFNSLGQHVRTLVNGHRNAGSYIVQWDGTNDAGEKVSSGVYFYRLAAGGFLETKKMILME
jgi:flagellar hook assembly protein FlgD